MAHQDRKSRKGFLFLRPFLAVFNFLVVWVVKRRIKKFPKITVIFALLGVVGSRGEKYRRCFGKIPKSTHESLQIKSQAKF